LVDSCHSLFFGFVLEASEAGLAVEEDFGSPLAGLVGPLGDSDFAAPDSFAVACDADPVAGASFAGVDPACGFLPSFP
jgi:hypothetical protein